MPADPGGESIEQPIDESWARLDRPDLPGFPLKAFPPELVQFVEAVAEATQTPVDLAAIAVLAVLSAAALGLQIDAGNWREELALYLLVAMPSGERKSSVMNIVKAPLDQIEWEQRELREPARRKAVFEFERLKKRRQYLLDRLSKTEDDTDYKELMEQVARLEDELAPLREPARYRLFASDTTAEALGLLERQGGRIAVMDAEGSFLSNLLGRYAEGNPNLDALVKAFTGERIIVDRRGREGESIKRPLLAIGLFVQDMVLTEVLSNPKARSQGVVARFGMAMPESRAGDRKRTGERLPPALEDLWAEVVKRIYALPQLPQIDQEGISVSSGSSSKLGVRTTLSLSSSAEALLEADHAQREPQLRPSDGELAFMADWMQRHHARALRIAGLIHLCEHGIDEPIAHAAIAAGLEIEGYFLEHTRAVLTQSDPLIRRALKWLGARDGQAISERDIYRGPLNNRGTPEAAARLAGELCGYGAIRPAPSEPTTSRGRPPSRQYEINPSLRSVKP